MFNKVILIGRLGREPEKRTSQSGKVVTTFTLATTTGFGENQKTEWHNVVCFDKVAESVANYLHKGSACMVEGKLCYDTYEKDGVKKTSIKISASNVLFVGTKSENAAQTNPERQEQKTEMCHDTFEGVPFGPNDEIPF